MRWSNKLIPSGIDLTQHCFLFKIKFKQIFCFQKQGSKILLTIPECSYVTEYKGIFFSIILFSR